MYPHVEEVSMKWIDRPSVTEMDRGGIYEMERKTKFQQKGNANEMVKLFQWIFGPVLECIIRFLMISVGFMGVFGTLSVYSFHRHFLYPFLWH